MVARLIAVGQKLGRSFSGKFALTNCTNLKISLTMVERVGFLTELALSVKSLVQEPHLSSGSFQSSFLGTHS